MGKKKTSLESKVVEWLRQEGYPLEYRTASAFAQAGFTVRQGEYVRATDNDGAPREIDIIASATELTHPNLRVEYVVECKWSRDKPWVIFTSPFGRLSPSACITQTISSELAHATLWMQAGSKALQRMASFAAPKTPGFGGRQALGQSRDLFYNSVQSVVGAARSISRAYDEPPATGVKLPGTAAIVFPVIVVDGELFEVRPSPTTEDITVKAVTSSRLHWRGSSSWAFYATVDVVTIDALPAFTTSRAKEIEVIFDAMRAAVARLEVYAQSGWFSDLHVTKAARGVVGAPDLIARISRAHRDAHAASRKHLSE